MDWKSEAEEKLRLYEVRRTSLEAIPCEIKRLEEEYTSIRRGRLGGPARGGNRSPEDAMLTNIVRREELWSQLHNAQAWCALVEKGLAALSETDRLLLDRFYIHPEKDAASRLCEELDLQELSSVYRRRRRALQRFTRALYFSEQT